MADVDLGEVFDAMPAACVVLYPDMTVAALNREWERLVGLGAEVVGRDVFDVLPRTAASANARASFDWVLAEGKTDVMPVFRYDLENPARPGQFEERYWNMVTAPVFDGDGRVKLLAVRAEDVTSFVDRLGLRPPSGAGSPVELETVGAELFVRARELREANERLRETHQRERRTTSELKETVRLQRQEVADVSHDLRNPIAGLQARVESALTDEPGTDHRPALLAAMQDLERLNDIVADLLELAQLDAGAQLAVEPVDLAQLVREALVRQPVRKTLATHLERPAAVQGSRSRLLRVLNNLLANADRHAGSAVDVHLTTEESCAVLRVIDDGPGIPAAEREAIFQRFYRRADARRADPGGTGLGLSIARQTALAHHGTLYVEDRPEGTCMVLRIPLASG
ncbi:PAS domain-containing sensor histidine kinase [Actinomadura sp. WMMB 499]|uniref:PAS domain-containing sensor histidine kinase n=1 Tax=Actinomadura sp. WMMB 499 TaxID=1219491 RepID=UPI0012449E13|nr:PAS domain-containing sensor histidine kinase [Actinomadura sp. WMMB 499]QFG24381.1 PAS domain-containing protein [Actinomadura sp. WMMB 499]